MLEENLSKKPKPIEYYASQALTKLLEPKIVQATPCKGNFSEEVKKEHYPSPFCRGSFFPYCGNSFLQYPRYPQFNFPLLYQNRVVSTLNQKPLVNTLSESKGIQIGKNLGDINNQKISNIYKLTTQKPIQVESLENVQEKAICRKLFKGRSYKCRNIYKTILVNMRIYLKKYREKHFLY